MDKTDSLAMRGYGLDDGARKENDHEDAHMIVMKFSNCA